MQVNDQIDLIDGNLRFTTGSCFNKSSFYCEGFCGSWVSQLQAWLVYWLGNCSLTRMRVHYWACAIIKLTQSNNVTGQLQILQHRRNLSNMNALAPAPWIYVVSFFSFFFFKQSEVCYWGWSETAAKGRDAVKELYYGASNGQYRPHCPVVGKKWVLNRDFFQSVDDPLSRVSEWSLATRSTYWDDLFPLWRRLCFHGPGWKSPSTFR